MGYADFGDHANAAIALAQQEANMSLMGHIATEHLLVGLASVQQSRAGQALLRLGVTPPAIRQALQDQATRTQRIILSEQPTSSRVDSLYARARELAAARGTAGVDSEDLLMALAEDPESVAVKVLAELGVSPAAVRQELAAG